MADVVLISGSPRANGNTEYALNVCKEEIEKHGLTAEIISLRGKQIHGCIACGRCGEQNCCAVKDDLNEIAEQVFGQCPAVRVTRLTTLSFTGLSSIKVALGRKESRISKCLHCTLGFLRMY